MTPPGATPPLIELPAPAMGVATRGKTGADDDIDADVSNPRHRDNRLVRLDRDMEETPNERSGFFGS